MKRRRSSLKEDKLARLIKVTLMTLEGLGVPEYFSERSNHLYSDRAKIALLVLRQYFDLSFRKLCSIFPSLQCVLKAAGTKYIPDHSTLVKFSGRLDPDILDRAVLGLAMMLRNDDITASSTLLDSRVPTHRDTS